MKKGIFVVILCTILSISVVSFAEQYPKEAVFNDFTIVFDKIQHSGDKFIIKLLATHDSETAARRQFLTLRPRNTSEEEPRYLTPEEVVALYDGLYIKKIYTEAEGFRSMTSEEIEATYPSGFVRPSRVLMADFKTLTGEIFPPDGSYGMLEFGSFEEPVKQKDGSWLLPIVLEVTNFSTSEEAVALDFYIYDFLDSTPYTGEVAQTMYINFPPE